MTLQDLRRYAIRHRCRIQFQVEAAGQCLVDEHGLLRIPALRTASTANVGELLGAVEQFVLEPAAENSRRQTISRAELEGRLGDVSSAAQHPEE